MDSSSSSPEVHHRVASTGESPIRHANLTDQPVSPKDERVVSENPYPDAAIIGPPREVVEQTRSLDAGGGDFNAMPTLNTYATNEQTISYASYVNSTGSWDGYPQYLNAADGLHMSPVVYNDNSSVMFHSGYGFTPEMAYGQYSPVATPMPPIMLEGQLFSPQQIQFAPSFYPQSAPPNVPSSAPLSSSEHITSESNTDNLLFGPGSGYLVQFGSFGGGSMSGTPGSSPLTSPSVYSHPMGILGSYEHHIQQISQQPSIGHYHHCGSYQSSSIGTGSISFPGARDLVRASVDKGRRRERNHDSVYSSNDSLGFDRNRGPRASKIKGKTSEQSSLSGNGKDDSSSSFQPDLYNRRDFVTDYDNAKFFIIKSFSEDNVHKSIKYSVWASTPHGNKKLDAAYRDAKEKEGSCPVFLLFSVNASGQFCGVAEMVGPVDFDRNADYWQQDRWSGQFPVQWHIIKDIPNNRFRHILLENNDNKPVTHSRDSQEVKLDQGIEMLRIFKDYGALTSILEDFDFYNQRERSLKERRAKQQSSQSVGETISQISGSLVQDLRLNDDSRETATSDANRSSGNDSGISSVNDSNVAFQHVNEPNTTISCPEGSISHSLSSALSLDKGYKYLATELDGKHRG